jgi:SAM-dependent methyltransferase
MHDTIAIRKLPAGKSADLAHETLKTFSLTHNYNLWIIDLFAPYIGKKILEIGSGIGNLTYYLKHFGDLSCVDISEYYLAHMRIDFPDLTFHQIDVSDDKIRSLTKDRFDTIVCVNVLEHVADDLKALTNMRAILQPGGRLLLYVPALPFLYGSVDQNLHHYRRYGKKGFESLLIRAGFSIEKLFYSNFIALFGWFFNSKIQRKKELSYWQTMLFDKFAPIFEKIESWIKPPLGMCLIAIARKNGDKI